MLHWIYGNTRHDKIRNGNIRESVGVAPMVGKWWRIGFGGVCNTLFSLNYLFK